MGNRFTEILFTEGVRAEQERHGSRHAYATREGGPAHHDRLGDAEAEFIGARDSFYMASVGETGWPYIQHRGGSAGFLRVLDPGTLGFADLRGNRQYISLGHVGHDARVALFLMDYPNRRRLKLLGRATVTEDAEVLQRLAVPGYRGAVEHGWLIQVEGFDWNCPQHITPRYTEEEVRAAVAPLHARIAELEAAQAGR